MKDQTLCVTFLQEENQQLRAALAQCAQALGPFANTANIIDNRFIGAQPEWHMHSVVSSLGDKKQDLTLADCRQAVAAKAEADRVLATTKSDSISNELVDGCPVCGIGFYLPSDVCDHCNVSRKNANYNSHLKNPQPETEPPAQAMEEIRRLLNL